jgi:hypothetical protein
MILALGITRNTMLMNTQQQMRSHVVSTGTMLRIIIPARVEILALPFMGLFLSLLLVFVYGLTAELATKWPRMDRVDFWMTFVATAGFACFVFPISRDFLLALGGRREIITLSPNMLCIRFSTLGMIKNREFIPDEVQALRLVPQEPDLPWPGGFIQFWYRGKEISFARQISYSEAEVLSRLMYRTGFLPNA